MDIQVNDNADEKFDANWADEIKRRLEAIDNGEVQLIPWEEVLESMLARLHGKSST
jgi:putative addiction module component (TIGR02574 family)